MALKILGLTGHQGSGKDAVADILVEMGGWRKIAFADPVRGILWAMNPVILDDQIPGSFDDYRNLIEQHGYDQAKRLYPEIRRQLQALATDGARKELGEKVWVDEWRNRAKAALKEGMNVVAPDVRFENEVHEIGWLGLSQSKIARVIRPGVKGKDGHESEAFASNFSGDFPIHNDGDLEELKATVERVLGYEKKSVGTTAEAAEK